MSRIAINTICLEPGRQGGAETYIRRLVESLQAIDTEEHFTILVGEGNDLKVDHPRFDVARFAVNPHHRNRRILWEQVVLPRLLKPMQFDLVHFPYSSSPVLYRGVSVVSIHDSIRFQFPKMVPVVERMYRWAIERGLQRRPMRIIGVSSADVGILRDHLRLQKKQITSVSHGLDVKFRAFDSPVDWARRADEVIWTGAPYPHKNLAVVFDAYRILKEKGVMLPVLRIIGCRDAFQVAMIKQQVKDLCDLVRVEQAIAHDQLLVHYRQAKLFLFPSKYESFGMPVLEAMGCGTPTIVSDIPAMREIYADAAVLCPEGSAESFAQAIEALLTDRVQWQMRANRGIELARRFSWEKCARATLDIYRATIADYGGR